MHMPSILSSISLFFVISLFFKTSIFKYIKIDNSKNRVTTIDGLRGFLAFSVVLYHGAIYRQFIINGQWAAPSNPYYTLIGSIGVATFFIITGYLFWSRLLLYKRKMNWSKFYINRVFRIFPVYIFCFLCVLIAVFIKSNGHLYVSYKTLLIQIACWLPSGILNLPDINNYPNTILLLAGVVWTLRYEWFFYFCLPFLKIFSCNFFASFCFCIFLLFTGIFCIQKNLFYIFSPGDMAYFCLFFIGMLVATLQSNINLRLLINNNFINSIASIFIIFLLIVLIRNYTVAYQIIPSLILGLIFYLIVSGCNIFGLLGLTSSLRMGEISYSIYLLQGIIYSSLFSFENIRLFSSHSSFFYWVTILLVCFLLSIAAYLVHIFIEYPGILFGKKIIKTIHQN